MAAKKWIGWVRNLSAEKPWRWMQCINTASDTELVCMDVLRKRYPDPDPDASPPVTGDIFSRLSLPEGISPDEKKKK